MIKVYWSPVINVPDNQEFVSELKYFEPETIYKDINPRSFFGLGAGMCPAIVDEAKNTFRAKSPIDFHIKFDYANKQATSKYDIDINFLMNYIKDHENLKDKNILLRLDLNVPLKNKFIINKTRIIK